MSVLTPFFRQLAAQTHVIACSNASSAAEQIEGNGAQVRIFNNGTVAVHYIFGDSTVGAAVFPTAGVPQDGVTIGAGAIEITTVPIGAYVRAITASGTSNLHIVRGEGV